MMWNNHDHEPYTRMDFVLQIISGSCICRDAKWDKTREGIVYEEG